MKAIFFDLDGVLIDTEWIYNKCWTQASKDLGYDLPPTEILKLRSCDKLAAVPIFGSVENYLAVRERRKQIMEKMLIQAAQVLIHFGKLHARVRRDHSVDRHVPLKHEQKHRAGVLAP